MAWSDDPELVAGIEPPPDQSVRWKLDLHRGDRVRYWNGEGWDLVVVPAPGNLDLYKRSAEIGEFGLGLRLIKQIFAQEFEGEFGIEQAGGSGTEVRVSFRVDSP